jgi:hypothetical protein
MSGNATAQALELNGGKFDIAIRRAQRIVKNTSH